MGEYLRLVNVSADCGRGAALHHFYLDIQEGEILFLAGIHWAGKPTVKNLLLGRTPITHGRLYVDELPYRGRQLDGQSVMCADRNTRFCENLSIRENLLSLQQSHSGMRMSKQEARRQIPSLLVWAGINRSPDTLVRELTEAEKLLLWMTLARVRWARLLILDCIGCAFSQRETEVLGNAMEQLKEEGITVMIMDEHPNGLLAFADRAVILKRGTVGKVLYPDEFREDRFLTYMTGVQELPTPQWDRQDPGEILEVLGEVGERQLALRSRQVIGLCDMGWGMDLSLPRYLQVICQNEGWPEPKFLFRKDSVYITEQSEEQLFHSMDIGDNISLVASRRLGGGFHFMRPGIKRFLKGEFIRKFEADPKAEVVEDLTCKEKKYLSIYRWELSQPRLWLMENPLLRISLEDRPHFKEYLRELAAGGSCLLVASREEDELIDFCDRIFLFREGHFQEIRECRSEVW